MIVRVYGSQRTSLSLSNEAYEIYINSDPFTIFEHEADNGDLSYSVEGVVSRDNMTEEDVEALLLTLAEDTVGEVDS